MSENSKQVICQSIDIPSELRFGQSVNAFRVVQDTGDEYLLDFLVYSSSEQSAKLVSRLRVNTSLVMAILDRLGSMVNASPKTEGFVVSIKREDLKKEDIN